MSAIPEGATATTVYDHPFEPDDRGWWSVCKHCHLAEASHVSSTLDPPASPPPEPPPTTERPEEPEEDRPTPLPVAEIDLSEMRERAGVKPMDPCRCAACGKDVVPVEVAGHLQCPECTTVIESCCD